MENENRNSKERDSNEEVAIPFNRENLWGMFAFAVMLSLSGLAMFDFLGGGLLFGRPHRGWVLHGQSGMVIRGIFAVVLVVYAPCFLFLAQWALFLGRCLWDRLPAVVFRRDGLVDNASYYWVGLIPWAALARAYPSDTPGLVRVSPVPRPVFLLLRDMAGFLPSLPWLKAVSLRLERVPGRLTICDGLLAVTSDEFVERLNDYYAAHVQPGGPA